MIAFLGLMIGLAALLSKRFSANANYIKSFVIFTIIGCIAAFAVIEYITTNLNSVSDYFESLKSNVDWSLSMVPLHRVGLYSGVIVFLVGVATWPFHKTQSEQVAASDR